MKSFLTEDDFFLVDFLLKLSKSINKKQKLKIANQKNRVS